MKTQKSLRQKLGLERREHLINFPPHFRKDQWSTFIFFAIVITIIIILGRQAKLAELKTQAQAQEVKIAVAKYNELTKSLNPIENPTPEQQKIISFINQTFGQYAPTAFLILLGDGKGGCHENGKLNPKAINDNRTWGGVGRDWGIFQISDHWQGVTNPAFLTDYKINILMAWNIFKRDNYSFKLWTCGKFYGV